MAVPVAVAVGEAADPLVDLLRAKALALRVGPGDAPGTELGPVISEQARARVAGYVADALAAGAVAVVDGRAVSVPGHEGGYFLGPTILDRVTPDMRAYCDEVFGPLLTVLRVDTFEAALDLVNSSPYGNGAAIFTSSGAYARRFTQGVQAGMVGVNVPIPTPVAYYSFGGWKDSLFGDQHAHGPEALRFYTRAKVVTTRWPQQGQTVAAPLSFPRTTD
jgi:malonate-semialdehyde dehydrogenase (acetylating)/methylmalonate-semialdehyde dehydrogenase